MGPLGISLSVFLLWVYTLQGVLDLQGVLEPVLPFCRRWGLGASVLSWRFNLCWGRGFCLAVNNLKCSTPPPTKFSVHCPHGRQSRTLYSAQPPACWLCWTVAKKSLHCAPFWFLYPAALSGSKSYPQSFSLAGRAAAHWVPAQHTSAPLLKSLSRYPHCNTESMSGFLYTPPLQKAKSLS